jgi:hypothetical protein
VRKLKEEERKKDRKRKRERKRKKENIISKMEKMKSVKKGGKERIFPLTLG